jgi:hypothetical protein
MVLIFIDYLLDLFFYRVAFPYIAVSGWNEYHTNQYETVPGSLPSFPVA